LVAAAGAVATTTNSVAAAYLEDPMVMKDLASNLPSSDEIIRLLGLQARRSNTDVMPSVALFGAGILVGAGLALLFAPTTGRELREEIGAKASEFAERVSSTAETAMSENGKATA
jgi:hypothetical protein